MNLKKNLGVIVILVMMLSALFVGLAASAPAADEVLLQSFTALENIQDGHAVVSMAVTTPEESMTATIEGWFVKDGQNPPSFRFEVISSSQEAGAGVLVVSDGETFWAYSPVENKVLVATLSDLETMLAEYEMPEMAYDKPENHPESPEEAVARLLEYFTADYVGTDQVAGQDALRLEMVPIAEQMPEEYTLVGGYLNAWFGKENQLPLAVEYTGGSMGSGRIDVLAIAINTGQDASLFTFEIPEGAELLTPADLESMAEKFPPSAGAEAGEPFVVLDAGVLPVGAVLVEVLEVRGADVLIYSLPEGGSFSLARTASNDQTTPPGDGQVVAVNGLPGMLYLDETGERVLLTWEGLGLNYFIAGNLTAEQALSIAESIP